jgi:gliding motility-associated-like protein
MILSRRAICLLFTSVLLVGALQAQLDTIHWLPPMHARTDWGPQYLYLSTPEAAEFPVTIRNGAGDLIATASISNTKPYRLDLGSTTNAPTLVVQSLLHMPLQDKGLVMDGPKKFYAYYRVHASSGFHAGDLTCKGRAALGQEFRVGHLEQAVDDGDRRGNFVGVMATEDSTMVSFSEFAPGTDFRIAGVDVPSSGPVTMTLQKGETVVFAQYINTNDAIQPVNGFMGGLLKSSKPVAVNCGSWVGAPVVFQAHDIGIDQIAPFEKTGTEYILCKGNGSGVLEHPIVIAHRNGTKVWLNGKTNPSTVLNAGQYYIVPTNQFSSAGNLYLRSSEPVFVYQMIGGTALGDDAMRTAGLMFVPPISCGVPNAVDNIFQPNRIGTMTFEGGLMLVAMKDSAVSVRIDGTQVFMGAPDAVPGNPDFVTYRNLKLFTQTNTPATISVVAQGAVQVAMYGRNEPASFAAFFSGFSKTALPTLDLSLVGDGVCPDTLIASGRFDGVQWMYGDSVLQFGPDTTFVAYAPGKYTAVGYLGVCRRTDFALDSVTANFVSPQFPYALEGPSCFGYTDGFIDFGIPYGGIPPYQYSIDNGQHFSPQAYFANLGAGDFDLVVRDSTGCYNRPLQENLEQPDSFYVRIVPLRLPDPPLPGAQVLLGGEPNRPVVATDWVPMDSSGCADCLFYTFRPEESTWVTLAVYDTAGCRAEDSLLVQVDPRVYVPNVMAPASAAGNDRFMLFSRDPVPIRRLAIYDRWGEQLFERRNIATNQTAEGWDGRFRGEPVLPGVYLYLAELEVSPGRVVLWKGDVTVVR